ncbi:hypothetical protein ALC57_02678 [Trachymyrmex cornetzi]|uniref:DUF1758 domain-containing protein n=1 Tax=Trachymyrmex cornetzi TaxID=471704 RepID=A0A151JNA8_9HYME|nr:hypothetical protein ALC57_02678 [Trachymyrmex cornetzi]
MTDKIKILIQKRTSVKSQITSLNNILDKGELDHIAVRFRMNRLTELYRAFEDHNDELAVLDSDERHQTEFTNLQDRYYSLASRVETITRAADVAESSTSTSTGESRNSDATLSTSVKKRRIKLPDAHLPTFDGKYESWLSFKNTFHNMIGSQTDLSEIDKLHYLKSALTGEAASKIRIFEIDGINYSKAWELLERAYEQHVASLSALGVSVGSEVVVHTLESKLPKSALERWETSLDRDEFPKLEFMYEFLYKSAVCASKRERAKATESERNKIEPSIKKKRVSVANQVFMLNASRNCVICKNKRHPLYLCEKFKLLSAQKRIDVVKSAKLCYNCLRSHRGSACKFSSCTICQNRHNTLLHIDGFAGANKSNITNSASEKTE